MNDSLRARSRFGDPYRLHRLALLPVRETGDPDTALRQIEAIGVNLFSAWVQSQGLAQVWRAWLAERGTPAGMQNWKDELREHARLTAAHQMAEEHALAELASICRRHDLEWLLFKGADLRRWLYDDPVLRPVSDIDLFVLPTRRQCLIDALTGAGYTLHVDAGTASHEVTLRRGNVSIDLHWRLLRPGRSRPGLTEWLFEHREQHATLPGLDATASLLVMLAHPAITKYLLSPTSILIHQVDQARLIRSGRVDWVELERALTRFGLRGAAWSALHVLKELSSIESPGDFAVKIRPGPLRRWYLRQWIDRGWISRAFETRWLVAALFSLALQDTVGDAFRALLARFQARRRES